jgi:tetratricopeptide (TPR) repeat protein
VSGPNTDPVTDLAPDVTQMLEQVLARRDAGDFAAADGLLRTAQALAAEHTQDDQFHVLLVEGTLHLDRGDADAAERAYREVAGITNPAHSAHRSRLQVQARAALGGLRRDQGEYDEAERNLREALALAEADLGPNSLEAAGVLNDLAMTFKYSGKFDEAERLYRRALAIVTDTLGAEHADTASIYHNLGGLAHARGDYTTAEPLARRAVDIRAATHGPDHLAVAADRAALAPILDELGQRSEAETLLKQALRVYERVYGPEHYEVAVTLHNLAAIVYRRGDLPMAEDLYRRALAIKESSLGPEHPDLAPTLTNLGLVCHQQGRPTEAGRRCHCTTGSLAARGRRWLARAPMLSRRERWNPGRGAAERAGTLELGPAATTIPTRCGFWPVPGCM